MPKDTLVRMMVPGTPVGDAALLDFIIQSYYHNYGPMAGDGTCPTSHRGMCSASRHNPIEQ